MDTNQEVLTRDEMDALADCKKGWYVPTDAGEGRPSSVERPMVRRLELARDRATFRNYVGPMHRQRVAFSPIAFGVQAGHVWGCVQ